MSVVSVFVPAYNYAHFPRSASTVCSPRLVST
jgi:hypothetical protein